MTRMRPSRYTSFLVGLLLSTLVLLNSPTRVAAYATPELNRRAMAGVWRLLTTTRSLVPQSSSTSPMKEFTTYPKKHKEFLLMLKEDGSFQQCNDEEEETSKKDDAVKGTWDYRDGQLILAADRSEQETEFKVSDTVLVGKVVATSDEASSLADHPELTQDNATTTTMDTHLSVPQGNVKVGKFMYPKHHPSFFEQPMFRPTATGSFQLRQVLGNVNTFFQDEEDELVEKFKRQDFHDKRFFLSSYPIPQRKPKGKLRWSIKYNKFVEDVKKQTPQQQPESIPIRVMEIALFANNTFSTIAGLGSDTILRGKWDIIGKARDQLWMQVWRFGFGRSVSGSVYSEGRGLTHNDDKTYWGEISYLEEEDDEKEQSSDDESPTVQQQDDDVSSEDPKRLQVKGSVLYGWGLEPQPVARFIMKESLNEEEQDEEEEDDDEDTTEEDLERSFRKQQEEDDNEDIDWSNAFQ